VNQKIEWKRKQDRADYSKGSELELRCALRRCEGFAQGLRLDQGTDLLRSTRGNNAKMAFQFAQLFQVWDNRYGEICDVFLVGYSDQRLTGLAAPF